MGLFTINTCANVGVDLDTGDYFCKIEHLKPTGVNEESRTFESGDETLSTNTKVVPICLPLRIWGKKFGDGNIKNTCDQAVEVKTTLF